MTPEQQKQFNAACETFGETMAKIFATEAPTMERQHSYYVVSADNTVIEAGSTYRFYYKENLVQGTVSAVNKLTNQFKTEQGWYPCDLVRIVGKITQSSHDTDETARDWEILAFRATSKCTLPGEISKSEGVSNKDQWTEKYLDATNRGYQDIYTVRRLSDDSTWTLGDEIIDAFDEKVIIRRFESTDKMNVWHDRGRCKLANISKVMDRVYTTADGIQVTKDQKLYSFLSSGEIVTYPSWEYAGDKYSSEEAAKAAYQLWLYKQPALSLDDILGLHGCPEPVKAAKAIVQQKLATK